MIKESRVEYDCSKTPRCWFFVTRIIHRSIDFCPGLHEALLTFQTVGPIAMEVQTAMPQTDSANALCRAMLH